MIKKNILTYLLILSLLINVALFGYLIYERGGIQYIMLKLGANESITEWTSSMKNKFALMDEYKPIKPTDIVFVGDSITAGVEWDEFINEDCVNRGIGGDNSYGLLDRIDKIIKGQPQKIFIMIGINDISGHILLADLKDNYKKLIEKIKNKSSNTEIYFQSVLPTDDLDIEGEQIVSANLFIKQYCDECNINYVDLYQYFVNDKGKIKSELTTDGTHLTVEGYKLWRDNIKQYIE